MKNLSVSVHRRLLNLARARHRPFNELLQHFVLERFLVYAMSSTAKSASSPQN